MMTRNVDQSEIDTVHAELRNAPPPPPPVRPKPAPAPKPEPPARPARFEPAPRVKMILKEVILGEGLKADPPGVATIRHLLTRNVTQDEINAVHAELWEAR